jgi:hypothetical protein
LTVTWNEIQWLIDNNNIKAEDLLGKSFDKDTVLGIQFGVASKKFEIGAAVDLSEQNLINICLTTHVHTNNMVAACTRCCPPINRLARFERNAEMRQASPAAQGNRFLFAQPVLWSYPASGIGSFGGGLI